jgi:serine/threonine protein kinase
MGVPAADATDRTLGGRYWLQSIIGRGGMATVYRARDEALGRDVAVKLFHANALEPTRQEIELSVLASLSHHGLVNLFDAGVEFTPDGASQRYLVMEFVNGTDLQRRLAEGPLAARHIAEIGYDLAEALEYVHSNNVIHRDIKPSNVLLVDYGDRAPRARAKLTDFGIALTDDVERMTAVGATTGTAAYLSPEQVAGAKVGRRSDVYSLGLVLLECFTGTVEFPGTLVESAIARLSRDPVIPEDLPDHWRELLTAMTAKKPTNRPPRRELVAMLKQIVIAESARHKDESPAISEPVEGSPRLIEATGSGILETLPGDSLDRVTAMAARLFSAPLAIISITEEDRTVVTSHRDAEFESIWAQDSTALADPAAAARLGLQFYAGAALTTQDGLRLGTLSVHDFEPRDISDAELANLNDLAALVVSQLDQRREALRLTGELRSATAAPAAATESALS